MNVLVIAPHADDETLGCGGTIARLADEGHDVTVALMSGRGPGPHPLYTDEAFTTVQREFDRACVVLGVKRVVKVGLPTVLLADLPRHEVNAAVGKVIAEAEPERLFVPFALDLHGDHRTLFHAASVAWRPYLPTGKRIRDVYCYEVPTETHLNFPYVEQAFVPNCFFDISGTIERKLQAFACFESQMQPMPLPRSLDALRALALVRGSQIGVHAAEAFVCVRQVH